eukprot:NODE_99_length_20465_cov_0.827654.p11 type:complete len:201 gc:universal NODE_99_length_20465_cov_0.827654:2024-1422(-)
MIFMALLFAMMSAHTCPKTIDLDKIDLPSHLKTKFWNAIGFWKRFSQSQIQSKLKEMHLGDLIDALQNRNSDKLQQWAISLKLNLPIGDGYKKRILYKRLEVLPISLVLIGFISLIAIFYGAQSTSQGHSDGYNIFYAGFSSFCTVLVLGAAKCADERPPRIDTEEDDIELGHQDVVIHPAPLQHLPSDLTITTGASTQE